MLLNETKNFREIKYDLKSRGRSQKALLAKFFLAYSFIN